MMSPHWWLFMLFIQRPAAANKRELPPQPSSCRGVTPLWVCGLPQPALPGARWWGNVGRLYPRSVFATEDWRPKYLTDCL